MTSLMQLAMLSINLVYGFIVFWVVILNYFFIKNETILVKVLLTSLFSLDFTILYLILIYKINNGIFHLYYLLAFGIGFYLGYKLKSCVKILTIKQKLIDRIHLKS